MSIFLFWPMILLTLIINFLLPRIVGELPPEMRFDVKSWGWIISMVFLALSLMCLGRQLTQRWDGILIDERNRVSLSRFQLILWTLLILPALATASVTALQQGFPHPLDIRVPPEVWVLLGISGASFVATPVILQAKTQQKTNVPNPASLSDQDKSMSVIGRLMVKTDVKDASWWDMFDGDEDTTSGSIDLSKVQQFFFTMLIVVIYGAAIFNVLGGMTPSGCVVKTGNEPTGLTYSACLPDLSSGVLMLLGISHLAYIASKATTKPPLR